MSLHMEIGVQNHSPHMSITPTLDKFREKGKTSEKGKLHTYVMYRKSVLGMSIKFISPLERECVIIN
jgi:hypothetical protein